MSDELRLPDDLAACEARLAAIVPPATGIDRDQLMYRAGWAAGAETARLARVNARRVEGGVIAAWSLTSAALAASLAVMATLQTRPHRALDIVAAPADLRPAAASARQPSSNLFTNVMSASPSRYRFDVGLLSLRRQALSNALATSPHFADGGGDVGAAPVKTARELMGELLPDNGAGATRIWPYKKPASGDSI
jgi:hypothetical protein